MKRIGSGLTVFVTGAALAAMGVRWLITPVVHPGSSGGQTFAVMAQIVCGVALAVVGWRADRRDRETLGNAYLVMVKGVLGVLAGAYIAGSGGHWLITPHPDAPSLRIALVWLQIAAGVWLMFGMASRAPMQTAT